METVPERTQQIERIAGLSIIGLLVIGSIVIVLPLMRAILWAIVFAVSVWPFFVRLEKTFGGRSTLAAFGLTLLLGLIFFVPVVYVGAELVTRSSTALDYAQGLIEKGMGTPPLWFDRIPMLGERLNQVWLNIDQYVPRLIVAAKPHITNLLGSVLSTGTGMLRVVLTAVFSLIVFFFLLKEGDGIRGGLEKMALRLGGQKGRHLLFVAAGTMRSVVFSVLAAAIVQGIMSIFGLWISGVPNAFFIGIVAGVFALVPIGIILVVLLPAAGWLFYEGHTGWGIFMLLWSCPVISNIDNVIRPMIISRGANVPFLVILLGVIGGLAFGGIIGLFVGVTLLSVFYTMVTEWVAGDGAPDAASVTHDAGVKEGLPG